MIQVRELEHQSPGQVSKQLRILSWGTDRRVVSMSLEIDDSSIELRRFDVPGMEFDGNVQNHARLNREGDDSFIYDDAFGDDDMLSEDSH